jgi:metal-responsive CopG/Arc/MetJ family transcriptional regulator
MPAVKTAISMDEQLFARVEKAAAEMEIPRSQLFSLAVEEFLEWRQKELLVHSMNESQVEYVITPEQKAANQRRREFMQEHMRRRLENDEA